MSESIPDTVWDLQKAQTLAAVIVETGCLESGLAQQWKNRKQRENLVIHGTKALDDWDYSGIPSIFDEPNGMTSYETPKTIAKDRKMVNDRVDYWITPYEEVYNLSPNAFAAVPTKEFMTAADRFNSLHEALRRQNDKAEWLPSLEKDMAWLTDKATEEVEARNKFDKSVRVLGHMVAPYPLTDSELVGEEQSSTFDRDYHELLAESQGLTTEHAVSLYVTFIKKHVGNSEEQGEALKQKFTELCEKYGIDPVAALKEEEDD
jgi:hypothetical protein